MATPLGEDIGLRDYVNTRASRFDYLYLKVYDLNLDLKGVMLMNIDGGGLRLLYYFYEPENTPDTLFDIFLQHAARLGTEIITSYDSTFNDYLLRKSGFPRLFSRKQVRKSFMPVAFRESGPLRYKIYDGDGA